MVAVSDALDCDADVSPAAPLDNLPFVEEHAQAPLHPPCILVPHNAPVAPAHIDGDDHEYVEAPPDGACLYHCTIASADLKAWQMSHNSDGYGISAFVIQKDAEASAALRDGFIEFLEAQGDGNHAMRLSKTGPAGYPEQDDFESFAHFIKGQIVLQVNEVQVVYGTGPLKMHIRYFDQTFLLPYCVVYASHA